ncbi:MAG: hypothetical protein ABI185_00365 [Ginsengibacter sp.]
MNAAGIRSYLYQIARNDCIKFYQQTGKVIAMQKKSVTLPLLM